MKAPSVKAVAGHPDIVLAAIAGRHRAVGLAIRGGSRRAPQLLSRARARRHPLADAGD
jgi:hypothetical protein